MKKIFLACILAMLQLTAIGQVTTLIPAGSTWKYLANGSNQGTAWRATSFTDTSWPSGAAELGYGDGGEATVVSYGPSSSNKYVTTYFRKAFTISNPSAYTGYTISLLRDDGAAVYVNGTRVILSNLPSTFGYITFASSTISGTGESTYTSYTINSSAFVAGTNVVAVEIHQRSRSDADISFNLKLEATASASCGTPAALSATAITTSSATFNWTSVSGATSYNIQYRIVGAATWSTASATTNTLNVTSLNAGSNYEFGVQANCNGTLSPFSTSTTFTTQQLSCGIPTGLTATSISTSSATLNWTSVSGATVYNIQYRIVGTSTWTTSTSTTNTLNISSLTSSSNYEFGVQANCNGTLSAFSASATFTTLTPCSIPTGITSSSVTYNAATLSWSAVSGAASYNVQYRIVGAATWTTVVATGASLQLTGLLSVTSYEFAVQTNCGTSTSSFSATASFTTLAAPAQTDSLIQANGSWKYLDVGAAPSTGWQNLSFTETGWKTGNAELGYGDGGEATVISYGPSSTSKYITSYFRKTFSVTNAAAYTTLNLEVVRDDGIIVYINGVEVYRNNMPTGTVSYSTLATAAISGADEYTWISTTVPTTALVTGNNIIAVEMHQNAITSSDISFNARLAGFTGAVITRGPYLQILRPTGITVRWRSNIATNSKVEYGTGLSYGSEVNDAALTTEHIITINNLQPQTKYYYRIGSSTQVLQGDANNFFTTATPTGTTSPLRIWVTGDFGVGSAAQAAVRDAFASYSTTTPANLWIWLGDNAYSTGTDAEFQSYVFNMYPNQFKNIPVYPSLGNHDYGNAGYQGTAAMGTTAPYFNNFSVPQAAEAGGVASGTEKYYSYNNSNIHFIVLDSYGALNTSGSPMYNWLVNDLAANTQRWTIVYFHHPPYTKGSHDSDTGIESVNFRQNIVPLFDTYHVDLVLSGHSHDNERSYLIHNHYGIANTFTSAMKVSTATNTFTKTPPYEGTIYAVCGTSGQTVGTIQAGWPMPCMYFTNNTNNCSMVIDVNGDLLNAKFLTSTGTIADQFTITKSGASFNNPNSGQPFGIYNNDGANNILLTFDLDVEESVSINLLDLTGRVCRNPVKGITMEKGRHEIELPNDLPSGIYLVQMLRGNQMSTRKIFIGN
jgi:hypothetical protein